MMSFDLLKNYEKIELINDGLFSRVDLMQNIKNRNKKLILKTYNKQENAQFNMLKYVFIENEALIKLQKSNYVVKLLFSINNLDSYYFGLEFYSNGNLQEFIENYFYEKFISYENFNEIKDIYLNGIKYSLYQILLGLEELYFKAIVHRDLKPDNILFDDKMNIKICDFGSAKILNFRSKSRSFTNLKRILNLNSNYLVKSKSDEDLNKLSFEENDTNQLDTLKSSLVGTPNFISPEILAQKTNIDHTCDLWSYGNLAYFLIFNEFYFDGNDMNEIFKKIKSFNQFNTKVNVDINIELIKSCLNLISKLIVKEPNERLGSFRNGGYENLKKHKFFNEINSNLNESPLKYFINNKNKLI